MSTDVNPVPAAPASQGERLVRVVVGRIGKAHGLKGEVSVETRTDEPDLRFAVGNRLFAGDPANRALTIASTRWHSGRLLVAFELVLDRTDSEALRGSILEADVVADDVPDDPDEYFDRQLVGLTAVDGDDLTLGTVTEVVHLPGHDLLAIATPAGEQKLVPFVNKIVPTVDLGAGKVVVIAPPGLFEELPATEEPPAQQA